MDMSFGKRVLFWVGTWFGRLTNTGRFILSAEMGAPFVSNLRLEWMRWFRESKDERPVVVQLLGDIDDLVSDEDNKDLRAAATSSFYWLRVRGTGHADIVNFRDLSGKSADYPGLGIYRRWKFLLAATGTVPMLSAASEEQVFTTDKLTTDVVFVLHGIRDLGKWSASFERDMRLRFAASNSSGKLTIVSPRYGYFSMGSFVFQPNREKYVRWLMDQYTETLARYPNVRHIEFFAHSNGTYLLASALTQYHAMRVERIAFAGSVVRRQFPWGDVFARQQALRVRNYLAHDDAVVGMFPRFFELFGIRLLHNDVGSAGFNGFDYEDSRLENVRIAGGHSAFQAFVPEISQFLLAGGATTVPTAVQSAPEPAIGWISRCGILVLWAVLVFVVVFPAVRVAMASGEYAWIPVSLYLLVVFTVLKRL